ncbi:hypothetical protein D3C80_2107720 [compost metagenome]
MLLDQRVPGQVGIAHPRTDEYAAARGNVNAVQPKAGDVDQALGAHHVFLHQVDQVGAPSDEVRAGVSQIHRFAD